MDLVVFGLLNIALLIVGFIVIRRRIEKQFGSQAFLERVEAEANNIITELNATTERNIRILEDTITSLQAVMDQAKNLESKLATKKAEAPVAALAAAPVATAPPTPPNPELSAPKRRPVAPQVVTPELFNPIDLDTDPQARILRLHAQGFDAEAIALRVGRTIGEVDLIIRLSGAS